MRLGRISAKALDPSTREEILNVAQKVFADVGFKEATIRQICKAAKANVCLVSYYFGGKDGLYKAIFERVGQIRADLSQNFIKKDPLPETAEAYREKLGVFLEHMFNEIASRPDFCKLMNREISDGMPRAGEVIKKYIGQAKGAFSEFIAYGQKKKFINAQLSPDMVAMSAINMFLGFTNQMNNQVGFFFHDLNSTDEIKEAIKKTVTTIFFDGVFK
ncbi:MAG: TetR/AcrR family transcriptional regulator [Oligoflexia bacterium]|nr:TetR/AcrR family transcriptional regulator [Oligoflexia bacterium]